MARGEWVEWVSRALTCSYTLYVSIPSKLHCMFSSSIRNMKYIWPVILADLLLGTSRI